MDVLLLCWTIRICRESGFVLFFFLFYCTEERGLSQPFPLLGKKKRIFWLVGVYGHINNSINSTQSYCFSFLYLKKKKTKLARKKVLLTVLCLFSISLLGAWKGQWICFWYKKWGAKKKKKLENAPQFVHLIWFFFFNDRSQHPYVFDWLIYRDF